MLNLVTHTKEEVAQAKEKLEKTIQKAVIKFERDTNLEVSWIDRIYIYDLVGTRKLSSFRTGVKIR